MLEKCEPEVNIPPLWSRDVRDQHFPASGHPGQAAQGEKLGLLVGENQQGQVALLPDQGLSVALCAEKFPEEEYRLLLRLLGNMLESSTKAAALQDRVIMIFATVSRL